jgi:hypothetical protein
VTDVAITASFYKVNEGVIGRHRFVDLAVDITTGGKLGLEIKAGSSPLDGWKRIMMVHVTGAVENGGYVAQFVVDAEPTADQNGIGDGKLFIYESDDAVDPLDLTDDAVGVVFLRIEGY